MVTEVGASPVPTTLGARMNFTLGLVIARRPLSSMIARSSLVSPPAESVMTRLPSPSIAIVVESIVVRTTSSPSPPV